MPKFNYNSLLTNLNMTAGKIDISSTATNKLTIGGTITNAYVDNTGKLAIEIDGTIDHKMTINGSLTTISLNNSGKICASNGFFSKYVDINGVKTNIPLDVNGRVIISETGTASDKVSINGALTTANRISGGNIFINTGASVVVSDNLLLENGFNLLQETGDLIILE
jgi:hypothetical protein